MGRTGPPIEGLAPLLHVFDMPTSIRFYRDVLGFDIASSSPARGPDDSDWVLLRLRDIEIMLNTMYESDQRPAALAPARREAHRDTALFFGCPDVETAHASLKAAGVEADEPRVASYGMKQLWTRDPDGYTLCFQWPAA